MTQNAKLTSYRESRNLNIMAADQISSFDVIDSRTENLKSAISSVNSNVQAIADLGENLGEKSHLETRNYIFEQHTETRQELNSAILATQNINIASLQHLRADIDRLPAQVKGVMHGLQYAADLAADQRLHFLERSIVEQQAVMNSSLVRSVEQIGNEVKLQLEEQGLVRRQNFGAQEGTSTLEKRRVESDWDPWRNTDNATFQRVTSPCPQLCSCICHKLSRIRFPRILIPLTGFLSITVSGLYMGYDPCNETTCLRRSIPRAELFYRFPPWLLARVLHLFVGILPREGPAASLRITRVVADDAEIMNLAKAGDVEGVRSLFQRRLASPNDVNSSCEVPILSVSIFHG